MNSLYNFKHWLSLGCALLFVASTYAQDTQRQASAFGSNGLARVALDGKHFYIDANGKRAFDSYEDAERPWKISGTEQGSNDTLAFLVIKDGLKGLRSAGGSWLLPPEYEQIERYFDNCWKVSRAGKQSFTAPEGELLPYFDEVGYLDGRYFDVKIEGKWGIYDREQQKLSIPAQYEAFDYCDGCGRKSAYVYAQQHGKWGVIDFHNRELIPFTYEHSHWAGMRSDRWISSFTKNGEELNIHIPSGKEFAVDRKLQKTILYGSEVIIQENGKYGLIDSACQEILAPIYDVIAEPNANDFRGYLGPYAIVQKEGKKGIYAAGQGLLIQPEWDDARVYDDFFVLGRNGQYGLYDHNGKELLAPRFSDISHINDYFYSSGSKGLKIFKTKQKALYGLYFVDSQTEIAPQFYDIDVKPLAYGLEEQFVVAERQGEQAIFDRDGQELLPLSYAQWQLLDKNDKRYFCVGNGQQWGLYDSQTKQEIIPIRFYNIRPLPSKPELLLTVLHDKEDDSVYGLYDLTGAERLAPKFGHYSQLSDHAALFAAAKDGCKAIVVCVGNAEPISLPTTYAATLPNSSLLLLSKDEVQAKLYDPFKDRVVNDLKFSYPYSADASSGLVWLDRFSTYGVARVSTKKGYGLLDSTGRWIKEPQYASALVSDKLPLALVAMDDPDARQQSWTKPLVYQYIDVRTGKALTKELYKAPNDYFMKEDYFLGDYLVIRKADTRAYRNLMGLIDSHGKPILPAQYELVETFKQSTYLLLQKDRKFGIADQQGNILLPAEFDNLLINRYDPEQVITFPLLAFQNGEWHYYKEDGSILSVEGAGTEAWSVNTSFW